MKIDSATSKVRASWLLPCLVFGSLLAASCVSGGRGSAESAVTAAVNEAGEASAALIAEYADELLEQAIDAEIWVTPVLQYFTAIRGGEMLGLEFRLKSRESTMRKISSRWDTQTSASPRSVAIRDTLRFTIRFEDEPPGFHNRSIRELLQILEEIGHEVIAVKNYWPPGDAYSGVNTVLKAPNGLLWELQFHTGASFKVKMDTHEAYEISRHPDTALAVKQKINNEVAAAWDDVPIPAGILEQQSLHSVEAIILRPE